MAARDETRSTEVGSFSPASHRLYVLADQDVSLRALPGHGRVVIGRSRKATVTIDHVSVSREHAALEMGKTVTVEDLASQNGTRVNGVPLGAGERRAVRNGEPIQLGSVTVVVTGPDVALAPESAAKRSAGPELVLESRATRALHEQARQLAVGPIPILLYGETGVGKELWAREVHRLSPRAARPFGVVNCAALAENLLESELFGHQKGAFTGAVQNKTGLLEAADGGSLFLDEVGELALGIQAKLLRALESGEYLPVGSTSARRADVRFIAATNRKLEEAIAQGAFRQDLYYRLAGARLEIPPLRERHEEIAALTQRFIADLCQRIGRARAPRLSSEALERLGAWQWPGNARELRNAVERATLLTAADEIPASALPQPLLGATPPAAPGGAAASGGESGFRGSVDAYERQKVMEALAQTGGNQTAAAKVLGMSRRALVARLSSYGLTKPRK